MVDAELGTVYRLCQYPVKSMRGHITSRAQVGNFGLYNDRRWLVERVSDGVIITAKLTEGGKLLHCQTMMPAGYLLIRLPSTNRWHEIDEELNHELSSLLGYTVRLVPVTDQPRATNFKFALKPSLGADSLPLHVIFRSTFRTLSDELPGGVYDERRFRPNLVIDAPDWLGFSEAQLVGQRLKIGDDLEIIIEKPTDRCPLPTRAQLDLAADSGLLRQLKQHHDLVLGVSASVVRPGSVCVGSKIQIMEVGA